MNHETIRALGQQHLRELQSGGEEVEKWRAFLTGYQPRPELPDDTFAWLTCTLALEGVAADNFGVGAVLVDGTGQVVAQAHNQVFHPCFRSDRHAEMVLLEDWEADQRQRPWPGGLTLYSSLEPCPMCLVRICNADVQRVLFTAPDPVCGMCQRIDGLPPIWLELARRKTFAQARCSQELTHAADQLFQLNLKELIARLRP
jgi:cytosine deaminase